MTNYDILKEYEAHKTPVPSYDEWEQLQHWADFTDDYHGLREKLEIAIKALNKIVNYNSVAEQVDKYYHIVIDVREIGKEALAKIKEIK